MNGLDREVVQTVLADWQTAPIDERLRAALGFLQKLTLSPAAVTSADIDPQRAAGISEQAIEDLVYVCFVFSVLTRLADAFDFDLTTAPRWKVGGKMAYWLGYEGTSLPG